MAEAMTTVDTWDREYQHVRSIPSSTRRLPSKALLLLEQLVPLDGVHLVLDAGCGNGRNAVYLAGKGCKVFAVDFSPTALAAVECEADRLGLKDNLSIAKVNILDRMPFQENSFDLCIDSYVSCHFVDQTQFHAYWTELTRITKPGGFIFSSVFSNDDEYYKIIAAHSGKHSPVVTDPINGISKRLYREGEIKSSFPTILKLYYFLKFQFHDIVLGRDYTRSLYIAILQK
jgi:SAM-dependent methyltransferase